MNYMDVGVRVLSENGLHNWKCKTSRTKTAWGHCNYSRKSIYISKYLLEYGLHDEIMQTIYHEVAHALTPNAGHGADWLANARTLGYSGGVTAERILPFKHRFIGHCSSGHKYCTENDEKILKCNLCSTEVRWYDRKERKDMSEFVREFGRDDLENFEKTLEQNLGVAN